MIELNKTIRWKPESTGTGRFGKWLEGPGGLEPFALALLGNPAAGMGYGGLRRS